MFDIIPSALDNYIYNTNSSQFVGGFAMTEFIKQENMKREMLGGSQYTPNNDIGASRFDGLAIPIGLVSYNNQIIQPQIGGKTTASIDVISDAHFDNLFKSVAEIKERKRKSNNTRKIQVKKDIGSKKNSRD